MRLRSIPKGRGRSINAQCEEFDISALENALWGHLASMPGAKVLLLEGEVSMQQGRLSLEDAQEAVDLMGIDFAFNCTGGRLDTGVRWVPNQQAQGDMPKEMSRLFGSEIIDEGEGGDERRALMWSVAKQTLTDPCLQTYALRHYSFISVQNGAFPPYCMLHEVGGVTSSPSNTVADRLSLLRPAVPCVITGTSVPLFNVGDSIMQVDYKKKCGLTLALMHIRVLDHVLRALPSESQGLQWEDLATLFGTHALTKTFKGHKKSPRSFMSEPVSVTVSQPKLNDPFELSWLNWKFMNRKETADKFSVSPSHWYTFYNTDGGTVLHFRPNTPDDMKDFMFTFGYGFQITSSFEE